ncbi:EamA family transporter RarD [Sphingomonas sp.]|jgi:chloramphenicol-sensitive protein RarD|uniref:EamA family transporter RarD n=1 Tax=Sphingomonas sp. TaxID=28214 RepID=UPI002D80FEFF|nr:EamA family transporter RarD [Sphingomonas sp.]HEU0045838.1 EamA family transporter RarD [Sphingomonas sp.]
MTSASTKTGLLQGIAAYLIWGLLPLYFQLLREVPAAQVVGHRVLWSVLLLIGLVVTLGRVAAIRAAANRRTLLLLGVSALLISINWIVYVWAVANAHVLEASLGYFINPLVNVALGAAVLRERVRPVQMAAVGLAAAGVLAMATGGGALWISLTLALSFGSYGLIRKVVAIDALGGLTIETLLLAPFAAAVLAWSWTNGAAAWGESWATDVLLAVAGVITAVPLLLFASAARRLRYATLGLLQYLAPSLVFLQAVFLFGEPLRTVHLVTFGLIWAGCAVYAWDSVRAAREEGAGKAAT